MGEIHRPTRGWSYGLRHEGRLLAVVATDTLIRERVAGLTRHDAVELSRLCAAKPDLCRVALRLWRSFAFPQLLSHAAAAGRSAIRMPPSTAAISFGSTGGLHSVDRGAGPTPGPDAGAEERSSGAGATIRKSGGAGPSVWRRRRRSERADRLPSTPRMASRLFPSRSAILSM